jgi:hypothetical protein
MKFIQNPKEVIDSGDPYAAELLKEARGVIMPRVPGMDQSMAGALLDLIENESRLEESNFPGLRISNKPISEEEVRLGRDYFIGDRRLTNRGPACISCHSAAGTGLLGGGRIGPDLTKVFERMGGRRSLAGWLLAPATPTMAAVFRDRPFDQSEIVPISAFFEDNARNRSEVDPAATRSLFVLLCLLGMGIGLTALGKLWGHRRDGVSLEEVQE